MVSFIIQISLGCLFLICGIAAMVKKLNWFWLPIGKKEISVDIVKYAKFMGITTIVWGLLFIFLTIVEYNTEINFPSSIYVLTFLIYQGLAVFGRIKYKK